MKIFSVTTLPRIYKRLFGGPLKVMCVCMRLCVYDIKKTNMAAIVEHILAQISIAEMLIKVFPFKV